MAKLGDEDMSEVSFDHSAPDDSSSESETEQKTEEVSKEKTGKESEIIEVNPKKKRVLSEKQLAALQRGREKKLKMNLSNKKQRMEETQKRLENFPSEDGNTEEDEKENQPPPQPPKLKRARNMDKKRKTPPLPPTPSDSEYSSEIETDEEIEYSPGLNTDVLIDKYLESHMKRQASKERRQKLRPLVPLRTYLPPVSSSCVFL